MKIYASLMNDLAEGIVWLQRADLPPRCVVKITHPEAGVIVFCEALQIEKNFLDTYNRSPRFSIDEPRSAIVMSAWFRARLGGLETQKSYPLKIEAANNRYGKLRACFDHPQVVVRVAAWLGVISVALGAVGVLLGVLSVCPK